jgi:hypothetical protein
LPQEGQARFVEKACALQLRFVFALFDGAPVRRAADHLQRALAEFQCAGQRRAQRRFVVRRDDEVGHRQLDVVLAEAVEARPPGRRQEGAVDAQVAETFAQRPLGEVGVDALPRHHQRRHQADVPAAPVAQDARGDGLLALRLDRHGAVGAVLGAELDVEQAQEVLDLGERADRALAPAAAGALLDGDGGRDAEDGVDVGPRRGLHELAGVGVERLEVAALALGEEDVEGQRGLA